MTRTDRIEAGKPIRVQDHVLIPIERTTIFHHAGEPGCWCQAAKQLIALVVRTASGVQAHDMEIGTITMAELRERVPEIADLPFDRLQ